METRSRRSFRGGFIFFFPCETLALVLHGRCATWQALQDVVRAVGWRWRGWGTSPLDLGRGCTGRGVPLGHGVVLPGADGEEDLNCPNSSLGKPSLWPQSAEHSGTVRMGRVQCQNILFWGVLCPELAAAEQTALCAHEESRHKRGSKPDANSTSPALVPGAALGGSGQGISRCFLLKRHEIIGP